MAVTILRPAALVCAAGLLMTSSGCQFFRRAIGDIGGTPTPTVTTTAELIGAMHAHYAGRWYSTLSATQENTRWTAGGREARNDWIEYVGVPGRMRIEFLPQTMRSGVLFEGGRVHTFDDGRRIETRRQVNALLLLTADVYAIAPDSTLGMLRRAGVAAGRFHERMWQGRKVYVAGALAGDTTRTQLWVDADRLVLVRWIERVSQGGRTTVTDTHLRNYRTVEGYPVAHESIVHRNGQRVLREVHKSVRVNPPLSPALFDPVRWRDARVQ